MWLQPSGATWGEQLVGRGVAGAAQMIDGPAHVEGVPVDDRGRHQVQARRPKLLAFNGAIGQAALLLGEHRGSQGMARLALVQPGEASAA